jgi:uncharacterized protein
MPNKLMITLAGLLAAFGSALVLAAEVNPAEAPNANDPSVSQIYDEARAGHVDHARQMMNQVLANHPHSARAHYVAAELDAELKNYGEAKQELQTAEQIAPGLPFANAESVAALRSEIGLGAPRVQPGRVVRMPVAAGPRSIPWGIIWVIAAVVFVVWLLMRRRRMIAPAYPPYPGNMPSAMGPGTVMPPGGGFPSVVGGGSGIVGGLASGLAVGAGAAAGEELVRHAFGSNPGVPTPAPENLGAPNADPNADLGGPDFGISDGGGGGWDDGGGGSGGDDGGGWT